MKRCVVGLIQSFVGLSMLAGITFFSGCDWSGGSGADYNNAFPYINFSGVYRGANGAPIVSDYVSGTPGSTNTVVTTVDSESLGATDGIDNQFSGTLDNTDIVAGSLTINLPGGSLTDNGSGGLTGSIGTGAISYSTGSWSVELTNIPDVGAITASYRYERTTSSPGSGSGSGATGVTLMSFSVQQSGNTLVIQDSAGGYYKGNIGISSQGFQTQDDEGAVPPVGTGFIGTFNAKGPTTAGLEAQLTGIFKGVIESGPVLAFRTIEGQFIESNSNAGNIYGSAGNVGLSFTTGSTAN